MNILFPVLLIDNDGNGIHDLGEDKRVIITATVGAQYMDQHVSDDDETDLIGDGLGWLKNHEGDQKYQAEFLFPLTADEQGQGATIMDKTRINILLYDHWELKKGTGNVASLDPSLTNSKNWPSLQLTLVDPIPRANIPDDLNALIEFVSTHEDERGEIYSFDPVKGTILRIAYNELY